MSVSPRSNFSSELHCHLPSIPHLLLEKKTFLSTGLLSSVHKARCVAGPTTYRQFLMHIDQKPHTWLWRGMNTYLKLQYQLA